MAATSSGFSGFVPVHSATARPMGQVNGGLAFVLFTSNDLCARACVTSARGRDLLQLPHFGLEQIKHCAAKSNKVVIVACRGFHIFSLMTPVVFNRFTQLSNLSKSHRKKGRAFCATSGKWSGY